MEGYKSKAGNGLLEICMGKNYQDSMVVYREYVQNACDAIYEANKLGYYNSIDEMSIAITIKPHTREICFMDRGVGVAKDDIGPRLVDIGASLKNGIDQIGSYGIGRLVGANWCDKIIFETSVKGENIKSILTFDSVLAHELVKDKTADCTDSLDAVTSCIYEIEESDEHYFRVTLVNAKDSLYEDAERVKDYLSSMVPVDYSYEFDDLIKPYLNSRFPEYKELLQNLIRCNITVNGEAVEKPYSNVIYSENSVEPKKITPPSFYKIEDSTYGLLAWGWYAFNEKIEQMNNLPYRGIRLRKHNMAIGGYDYLDAYFPRKVDAGYFIGEIHIVHNEIHPTGTREAVETSDSPVAGVFLRKLEKVLKELKKDYENLSRIGSSGYAPIISSVIEEKTIRKEAKSGSISEDEASKKISNAKSIIEKAIKEYDKKNQALQKSQTTSPDVIDFLAQRAEKKFASEVNKYNEKNPEKRISVPTLKSILESKPNITTGEDVTTTNNFTSKNNIEVSKPDPTKPEIYKILGNTEYKLMKQIFKVLDGMKELPPQTIEEIKKKIGKKLLVK